MAKAPVRPTLDFDTQIAKFTPRQMQAVQAVDSKKTKFILFGGALGGGKALSLDTSIPTPFGWTTMGEVSVGDIVFDEKGDICNVVWVSGIVDEDTYRVNFSDGSEIIAGANHQWVTSTLKERVRLLRGSEDWRKKRRDSRPSRLSGNKSPAFSSSLSLRNTINPTKVKDSPSCSIRTTKQIADTLMVGPGRNHSIAIAKAFNLPNQQLNIDPYVLGAWLGDGTSTVGDITGVDEEIFDQVANGGYVVSNRKNPISRGVIGLTSQLRSLGVLGNKHIPTSYLRASKEQRLSLLQGIMDTDGTCDKRGQCEITLTNKRLSSDVKELIISLGSKAVLRESQAKLNGNYISPRYRIKFLSSEKVFRLSRKAIRQKVDSFRGTHDRRYIVGAKMVDRVPLRCIQVDSSSHMYLCGENMIPTHNSYGLRWLAARLLMEFYARYQLKYVQVMLACEDFPSLKDRQISKIAREFPEWMGQSYLDHKDYGRCFILSPEYGNGVICFRNLDDASKYASAEFAAILVDELTKNDLDTFNFLRTRLRWPGVPDQECVFVAGTNPGGIGHGWVKALWMDKTFPDEFIHPTDYRPQFTYIPSKADDNPYLDASYWSILSTLPETLRKAFRDGDWDTYVGQAFPEFGKNHIIKPTTVPEGARIYMTFDWGYGAPFSLLWWWVDGDGRVYLFNEWYGWNGSPNQGMRLTDPEIGKGILEREDNLKIVHKDVIRLAGPDCFSKKPDYRGGGQGPSTAEVFSSMGIHMSPGDPSRELKIRQFRERLRVLPDSPPMMLVYDSCVQFIRTIPLIQVAKNNPEYLDEDGELHCFDAACHIMMSRPLALAQPKPIKTAAETHIEKQISGKGTDYEDAAGVAALTAWKDVEIGLQRQRGTYSDVDGY